MAALGFPSEVGRGAFDPGRDGVRDLRAAPVHAPATPSRWGPGVPARPGRLELAPLAARGSGDERPRAPRDGRPAHALFRALLWSGSPAVSWRLAADVPLSSCCARHGPTYGADAPPATGSRSVRSGELAGAVLVRSLTRRPARARRWCSGCRPCRGPAAGAAARAGWLPASPSPGIALWRASWRGRGEAEVLRRLRDGRLPTRRAGPSTGSVPLAGGEFVALLASNGSGNHAAQGPGRLLPSRARCALGRDVAARAGRSAGGRDGAQNPTDQLFAATVEEDGVRAPQSGPGRRRSRRVVEASLISALTCAARHPPHQLRRSSGSRSPCWRWGFDLL
jgi:hypothetical protein